MPLYEYQCDSCGNRFERIQKFSDPPVAVCPKCGGPVHKLISSPAIQFKGSGWYVTDYGKSGKSSESTTAHGSSATSSSTEKPAGEKAEASAKTASAEAPTKTPTPTKS